MRLANTVALIALACLLGFGCDRASDNTNKAPEAGAVVNANAAPASALSSFKHLGNHLHSHEEAGIKFEVPHGWHLTGMGDQLVMIAPDESMSLALTVTDMTNLQQVEEEIDEELSKAMSDVKVDGKPREHNLNGMQAIAHEGTARIDGKEVLWSSALIAAKKPVLIYAFADPERAHLREPEVDRFIGSIKRLE
jgi:hypothetical protein